MTSFFLGKEIDLLKSWHASVSIKRLVRSQGQLVMFEWHDKENTSSACDYKISYLRFSVRATLFPPHGVFCISTTCAVDVKDFKANLFSHAREQVTHANGITICQEKLLSRFIISWFHFHTTMLIATSHLLFQHVDN